MDEDMQSPFIISATEAAQTQARSIILRWRWKYLWTCRSSASAPTGPAGCSCTSDTRRSEGSGTTTATGTFAQTARGDRTRPRTPLARGRPPGSRRPARWRGSPEERRHQALPLAVGAQLLHGVEVCFNTSGITQKEGDEEAR